jgi:hypothetical protein
VFTAELPASVARARTEKWRRVYCAPHSKCSSSSVRAEKRCPLGQVIVTCASLGFWFSGACAVISPHSGHPNAPIALAGDDVLLGCHLDLLALHAYYTAQLPRPPESSTAMACFTERPKWRR